MTIQTPDQAKQTILQIINTLVTKHAAPLEHLTRQFQLSPIDRQALLLCLGQLRVSNLEKLCATVQEDPEKPYPTLDLICTLFPEAEQNLSFLAFQSPVFQHHLIEIIPIITESKAPLRLNRTIYTYFLGQPSLDPYLNTYLIPILPPAQPDPIPPTYQTIATTLTQVWKLSPERPIQLSHPDSETRKTVALAATQQSNYQLHKLHYPSLPTQPETLQTFIQHWQRHHRLSPSTLLLECSTLDPDNPNTRAQLLEFIDRLQCPLLLSSSTQLRIDLPLTPLEIPHITIPEQQQLWKHYLGDAIATLNSHLNQITSTFNLAPHHIKAIAQSTLSQTQDPETLSTQLWVNCRNQTRSQLESFARRIDAKATWDDLVLPTVVVEPIKQIIAQMRNRHTVYEDWELAGNNRRGLGIVAMFYGTSGTGKTTAAEIIAHTLNLDLYRIDLSQVVSKYIGETEKNLSKVFDAAESAGAILQFDEADSIIGKRSDVKDARDRYANQEVGYVLQRIESYSGLAILTTNLPNAMDSAFQRRIRFIVRFELPNKDQRGEIWQRLLKNSKMPLERLNADLLSQLEISGASIINIARNAAFLAAEDQTAVQPQHMVAAARSELQKLGRGLTEKELSGWPR